MRDDAWHEDAYDRDDMQPPAAADDLDARYGRLDPRANGWTWTDIGVGWVAGLAALVAVGVAHGGWLAVIGAEPTALISWPFVMALVGGFVLAVFGIPVAVVLATLLRTVRCEAVHVAAFAGAGLLGAGLLGVMLGGVGTFVVLAPYAVAAAVAGRLVAKRLAIRRVERPREPRPADPG